MNDTAVGVICFSLGFIAVTLMCCYWKLCAIARDVRPKHQ